MSDRTNKILCLRGLVCPLIYFVALVLAGCGGDPVGPIPVPDTDYKGLDRPAQPYGALVERVAAFLMSDKGSGGFGEGGKDGTPPYFYSYGICDRESEAFGCERKDQLTPPISYPAYTCYTAIQAFGRYYVYSGNEEARDRAEAFANWVLERLTPETDALGGLAYSTQAYDVGGGGADGPSIELDKAAMFALGLLDLYDMTGTPRYREEAVRMARTLVSHQQADGSWAFRVIPSTGEVYRAYTSDQIPFVHLLARVYAETGEEPFLAASEKAWAWLLENPVTDRYWANFYEDMDDPESLVNFDTLETIRELLARRGAHPDYVTLARTNFQWIEDVFLLLTAPYTPLIPSIGEQTGFHDAEGILAGTSSSTAQWAAVGLDLYAAVGEPRLLQHAVEAANVVASAQQEDGRMFTVTADANGAGLYPITWYEQCFAPLWFMLEIMGKLPETAPEGENHMLSHTAPIRHIVYEDTEIRYRTHGPGSEVLKVSGPVLQVLEGGALPAGHGPATKDVGWEYDPATHLLTVRHTSEEVQVLLEGEGPSSP